MKGFLNALFPDPGIQTVEYLTGLKRSMNERQVRFDLRVVDNNRNTFIVEFEKAVVENQQKRWIFYAAKEYVEQGNELHRQQLKKNITKGMDFYGDLVPVKAVVVYDTVPTAATAVLNAILPSNQIVSHIDLVVRGEHCVVPDLSWTFIRLDLFKNFSQSLKPTKIINDNNNHNAPGSVNSAMHLPTAEVLDWMKMLARAKNELVSEEISDEGLKKAYEELDRPLEKLTDEEIAKFEADEINDAVLEEVGRQHVQSKLMEAAARYVDDRIASVKEKPSTGEIAHIFGLSKHEAEEVLRRK